MTPNPQVPPAVVGCKACGQAIVFLKTAQGKNIPVNAETHNGSDHFFDRSKHTAHFSNCTNPERFRKRDQPKGKLIMTNCPDCGDFVAIVKDAAGKAYVCDYQTTPPTLPYAPHSHKLHDQFCKAKKNEAA